MDLLDLRNKLDEVDEKIVELYEERMDLCSQVAQYKIETGRKVFDRQREQEKLAKVRSLASNEFNSHGVEELFEQLMAMSRKLQYQILTKHETAGKLPFIGVDELTDGKARVVFQGAEVAYSQIAMQEFFGEQINSFHVDSFRDAIENGSL